MGEREGVVKYRLAFTPGPPLPADVLAPLITWQRRLHHLGLVGRDPARYGGLAFGNLSRRLDDGGFAISASQTGDTPEPGPAHYARVTSWDCADNRVVASGPAAPSSEALSHAALYDADPAVAFVFHVHAPAIWQRRDALGLPTSAADIPYGTPAMAAALVDLHRHSALRGHGVIAMGGHVDGIITCGRHADEAGETLLALLPDEPPSQR